MTTIHTDQKAVPARWSVEREQSSVDFEIKTFWGLATVRGRFHRFEGTYELGADGTTIRLALDVDSLDTGNAKRDHHLRAEDFFHLREHPEVYFTSTRVVPAVDGMLLVEGDLEAAGKVVPLAFTATLEQVEGGLQITASTQTDPRQFGMSSGTLGMIRPSVTLSVTARLTEEKPAVEAAA